jgi:hypothetical protein
MNIADGSIGELLNRSNDIRRGADADPNDAFKLAKRLAGKRYLEHARRLAQHIVKDERLDLSIGTELRQKWALWTSQNPDAPDDSKHDEALAILDRIKELPGGKALTETTDPETLGIAGGVCKRKWIVNGQLQTLEQSLRFYERGAKCGIESDNGYTAINAAFVLDLLADPEGAEDGERRERARQLREQVRDKLLAIKDQPAWTDGPPREKVRWFNLLRPWRLRERDDVPQESLRGRLGGALGAGDHGAPICVARSPPRSGGEVQRRFQEVRRLGRSP